MLSLGAEFERAVLAAAGLGELSMEPGSLQIDTVHEPMTTVRFMVVASVPGAAVLEAARVALDGVGGEQ